MRNVHAQLRGFGKARKRQLLAYRAQDGDLRRVIPDVLQSAADRRLRAIGLDSGELRHRNLRFLQFGEGQAKSGRIVARQLLLVWRHVEQLGHPQCADIEGSRLRMDE